MMWISIIALVFSGIGTGVSIWAIFVAKKSNSKVLHQNLESELASIETEIADINVQIERAKNAPPPERVYGLRQFPHYAPEVKALNEKKNALLKRKQEIERQLSN